MGYCSEVAYAIVAPKEKMLAFIAEARLKGNEHTGAALAECVLSESDDDYVLGFHMPNCKWYSEYNEVKAHEEIWVLAELKACDDEDFRGAFARAGDNADDNEARHIGGDDCYDLVCLSRSVHISISVDRADDVRDKIKAEV